MVVIDDELRVFVGDVRTGKIHADLPVTSPKWGIRLNGAGPVSATVRCGAKQAATLDLRNLTSTTKQFLGVAYGDNILECGPIWTRKYHPEDNTLDLAGLGLWSIFDRRKNVRGTVITNPSTAVTTSIVRTAEHLGSIGRELVRISTVDNPYGALPVVLPSFVAGTDARTYQGFNLSWIGDDLRELSQAGPDIRFRPRFKASDPSYVEWAYEHGQNILSQSGPDWIWDASVEKSGLASYGVDQDSTKLAAMAWVPGSGQEQSMRLATSQDLTLVNAGYPWTETENASKSEENLTALQGIADRSISDTARPWDTWTMTVKANVTPKLGLYLPGDWVTVYSPDNHPVLLPGLSIRARILAVDGDDSKDVKLTVAPIQGMV